MARRATAHFTGSSQFLVLSGVDDFRNLLVWLLTRPEIDAPGSVHDLAESGCTATSYGRLRGKSDAQIGSVLPQTEGADDGPMPAILGSIEEDCLTRLGDFEIDRGAVYRNGIVVIGQVSRNN